MKCKTKQESSKWLPEKTDNSILTRLHISSNESQNWAIQMHHKQNKHEHFPSHDSVEVDQFSWYCENVENWWHVLHFLCLSQHPSCSSSIMINNLQIQIWHIWITFQLCTGNRSSHWAASVVSVWSVSLCPLLHRDQWYPRMQHGDAAECVAMCAVREIPPPHASLLMAWCIWWRLPPTHSRPCSPFSLTTQERHPVDSGCNCTLTSLLPSPWPTRLYTWNNLWCMAFSSDCTSTVGLQVVLTWGGGGGGVVFPNWW